MHTVTQFIVYPDGEEQEIEHEPPFNALLGVNGHALDLPIPSAKALVYRTYSVRRKENKGETIVYHLLEQVLPAELESYTRR